MAGLNFKISAVRRSGKCKWSFYKEDWGWRSNDYRGFIVAYNATFKYLEENFGTGAVYDLWKKPFPTGGAAICAILSSLRPGGHAGILGGDTGTLAREKSGI